MFFVNKLQVKPRVSCTFLALLLAGVTFVGTATAVDVNGELQRHADNEARLKKVSPTIRPKVAAVIADLENHGYRPVIDSGVWRSPAEQAAKVLAGVSQVSYSFHNCTTPSGQPDSLAADITDKRWGWDSPSAYWLKLASAAESHQLTTGIYWGLSQAARNKIHAAIAQRDWEYSGSLGWDTAHVEPTGITIAEARRGVRPHYPPPAPLLVINNVPIRVGAAYIANSSWYVQEGELARVFGKAAGTPSLFVPLRARIAEYSQAVVAYNNRLSTRNRFDVRTAAL